MTPLFGSASVATKPQGQGSQSPGIRPRRGSPDPAATKGWTHLASSRSSRRTQAVEGVAHDGGGVGRDASLDIIKDTSPDPTPAFLPPEHEGRGPAPTHSLSGRLVLPRAMQGPPRALAMKNSERGRARMTATPRARPPPSRLQRAAPIRLKMRCAMLTPDAQRILRRHDSTSYWTMS